MSRIDSLGGPARTAMNEGGSFDIGIVATSQEEMIAQIVASLDDQRSLAREARGAVQDLQRESQQQRIAKMHDAADLAMAAGIVTGVGTMASGMVAAAGTATAPAAPAPGAASPGGTAPAGGTSTAPSSSPGASAASDDRGRAAGFEGAQSVVEGGAQVGTAILNAESKHREADAARLEQLAGARGQMAQELGESAQSADRSIERAIGHLDQIMQAKRQAEQAALRA